MWEKHIWETAVERTGKLAFPNKIFLSHMQCFHRGALSTTSSLPEISFSFSLKKSEKSVKKASPQLPITRLSGFGCPHAWDSVWAEPDSQPCPALHLWGSVRWDERRFDLNWYSECGIWTMSPAFALISFISFDFFWCQRSVWT